MAEGRGYDMRRTSKTTGVSYFYSATLFQPDGYIIRTALPYNLNLTNYLAVDSHYIWFTAVVTLLLIFMFYKFTSKLGTAVTHLREFAQRADRNDPIDTDAAFPHNELGEISQHIIQIYKRLRETKEALYIEREKLIMHLQTSREGLGVFTQEKKEILVNNLFTPVWKSHFGPEPASDRRHIQCTGISFDNRIHQQGSKAFQRTGRKAHVAEHKQKRAFVRNRMHCLSRLVL